MTADEHELTIPHNEASHEMLHVISLPPNSKPARTLPNIPPPSNLRENAIMTRRINAAGLSHIKSWEGVRLTAYLDVANVLTIGYGSTGSHVKPGMKITQAEADALLRRDLDRFEKRVEALVKVPLSDNQFAALVSFDFNTGALHKSTLLKKLNAGDYKVVPSELMKWTKAKVNGKLTTVKGLVNRRTSEIGLWKSSEPSVPAAPSPPAAPAPQANPAGGFWATLIAILLRLFKGGQK